MHWLICLCSSYFLTNTCIVYSVKMIQCILTLHMYICRGVGQGCGGTGIEGAGSGGKKGREVGGEGAGSGGRGGGKRGDRGRDICNDMGKNNSF